MKISKIFSFIYFLLFISASVFGQTPVFKNIKNGLASSEVYKCIQDKEGYLWFATENGVNKYDGYSFKLMTIKDGLTDNTITDFFVDSKNRIWFMPLAGLPSFYESGKINNIHPQH